MSDGGLTNASGHEWTVLFCVMQMPKTATPHQTALRGGGAGRLKLPESSPPPTPSPTLLCTRVPWLPCSTHSALPPVELLLWE